MPQTYKLCSLTAVFVLKDIIRQNLVMTFAMAERFAVSAILLEISVIDKKLSAAEIDKNHKLPHLSSPFLYTVL